jgi:centriolar protein POC1
MGQSRVLKAHLKPVKHVAFSRDERFLITASDDKNCKIWTTEELKFVGTLKGHLNWVNTVQYSPDGLLVLSASEDKTVRLWDTRTRQCAKVLGVDHHETAVHSARFHPDGTLVATAAADGTVKLFDMRSSRLLQHYDAHSAAATAIDFHASGAFLVSASRDSTVKVWDLTEGHQIFTIHGHTQAVETVAFSPSGDYFCSGAADTHVMVWQSNFDKVFDKKKSVPGKTQRQIKKAATAPAQSIPTISKQQQETESNQNKKPLSASTPAIQTSKPAIQQTQSRSPEPPAAVAGEQISDKLATTLDRILSQVEMIRRTLFLFEERLTLCENKVSGTEARQADLALRMSNQVDEAGNGTTHGEQLPMAGWTAHSPRGFQSFSHS